MEELLTSHEKCLGSNLAERLGSIWSTVVAHIPRDPLVVALICASCWAFSFNNVILVLHSFCLRSFTIVIKTTINVWRRLRVAQFKNTSKRFISFQSYFFNGAAEDWYQVIDYVIGRNQTPSAWGTLPSQNLLVLKSSIWENQNYRFTNLRNLRICGRGRGIVFSILPFCSDDMSLSPAGHWIFCTVFRNDENKGKRGWGWPI